MKHHKSRLFWLLIAVVVSFELFSVYLAEETLGFTDAMMYFWAIALNIPLVLLSFKTRKGAAVGIFLLGALIVTYQVYLGIRLLRVQNEAHLIVAYIYQQHARTGSFPENLNGYTFHDPAMREFVQEYTVLDPHADFRLMYRVGTEDTSHYYLAKLGWGYYDD